MRPRKGVTLEEAMKKVEADAYDYIDRIDTLLRGYSRIIAEAAASSVIDTSSPVQRSTTTTAPQQPQ